MITSFGLPVTLTAGRNLIAGLLNLPRDPLAALILTTGLTAMTAVYLARRVLHRFASRRRPNS